MILYTAGIWLMEAAIRIAGLFRSKERLWVRNRRGQIERIRSEVGPGDRIFWLHAASVGEFEQGRPIMEAYRAAHPDRKILLTFFSSSGYELRKNFRGADYVYCLPPDRPRAVRRFLDAVHPETAVFVKYEFWLNMLSELQRRSVRTFLVSAVFRPDSVFFKPWGGLWRKALLSYETIFVQNRASLELLAGIGVHNVTVAGDTRFDRVYGITQSEKDLPLVDRFCAGDRRVFVAGSTWGPDEDLIVRLANANPGIKFIVAPHEMSEDRIGRLMSGVEGGACRYSEPESVSPDCRLLVVDTIGILSFIYRYAGWAYVGGGFTFYIHNILEPASYGLPVAFGPRFGKSVEAVEMVNAGSARSVCSFEELEAWFNPLRDDENLRLSVCAAARAYTLSRRGATDLILEKL